MKRSASMGKQPDDTRQVAASAHETTRAKRAGRGFDLLQGISLAASDAGDARIGPVQCVPAVLTELGVIPRRAFARAGVRLQVFSNPENRISFEALCSLLAVCAEMTGCSYFGLLVGRRFSLKDLGAVGYLMRNSATVGEALRALLLHLHLHDRGAVPVLLELDQSTVLLGYSIYRHGMPSTLELYDVVIAVGYAILRELCGPDWRPALVQFSHVRPKRIGAYRGMFGPNLRFDAEVSGLAFASSWLRQPVIGADPALRQLLKEAIERAQANGGMTFAQQVQGVLHQAILSGMSSAGEVARLFGIHERTLRKRLSAGHTSLQRLVTQTRFELAQQLLRNTRLPVSEIAAALRYSDPNVFSRAFRNWAKVSPRQWRAGQ
jgi:AraC-like DNA-binding protein